MKNVNAGMVLSSSSGITNIKQLGKRGNRKMKVCTGYTLMFSVLWEDVESRIWDLIYICDELDKTSMIEVAYTENDSAVLCWHGIKSVSKAKELAKEAWKIFPIQEAYIELQKEYLTGCYCDVRTHSKIWRPKIVQS